MPDLTQLLHHLLERRGSDLHLKVGSPPYVRVDGHLEAVPAESCSAGELERIVQELVPPDRSEELTEHGQVDFAHSVPGLGRFRVNLHRQRGSYGVVVRRVQPGMPSLDQLNLPVALRRLSEDQDGLIIVSGSPGSGRSTTVAMLVDRINENRAANIVTIEDPIEFLHIDKRSIVTQREVGSDTPSFAEGARRVLRQDPDVIFLGEIPDPETAAAALLAASNGRLVLACMATTPAPEVIERIIDFFPPHQQRQTRQTIAGCLRGIVCQRLVERGGRTGTSSRGRSADVHTACGRAHRRPSTPRMAVSSRRSPKVSTTACRRSTRACSSSSAKASSDYATRSPRPPDPRTSASRSKRPGWR